MGVESGLPNALGSPLVLRESSFTWITIVRITASSLQLSLPHIVDVLDRTSA